MDPEMERLLLEKDPDIRTAQFCLRNDSSAFDSLEASVAVVSNATMNVFWAQMVNLCR